MDVVILSGVRTPLGSMGGAFAEVPAPALGSACVKEAVARAAISLEAIDEVLMGNVLGAGLGQNPARQTAIQAGLPVSVGATTVSKVCGSGLRAVILAAQAIRLGDARVVVAGGVENMTRAPFLLMKARLGYRLGNGELIDAMVHDGLRDAYGHEHMGVYADRCAAQLGISRREQDDFAVRSYSRAQQATACGAFRQEIVPWAVAGSSVSALMEADDGPRRFNEGKLRALKPAFREAGTITAGNASSISDGAAALVLADAGYAAEHGHQAMARVADYATFSREPEWFSLAPVGAVRKLLEKLGWKTDSVDLFEINEAFAAVALACQRELRIPDARLNIHGGAVALGHPIGASGARILVTLLSALRQKGGKRGIAALCIGGGEAVALAVELV